MIVAALLGLRHAAPVFTTPLERALAMRRWSQGSLALGVVVG